MTRRVPVALCVLAICLFVTKLPSHAWIGPMSMERLVRGADRLVVGEVQSLAYNLETVVLRTQERRALDNPTGPLLGHIVFTYLDIQIDNTVALSDEADSPITVTVRIPGGAHNGLFTIVDEYFIPQRGDRLALFLRRSPRPGPPQFGDVYTVVGAAAGAFSVESTATGAFVRRDDFPNSSLESRDIVEEGPIGLNAFLDAVRNAKATLR